MAKQKPQPKPQTWHLVVPTDIYQSVQSWASKETRTIRNMAIVLLREALTHRNGGK